MTTRAFSTSADHELLIAFVALDGPNSSPQTATVSGADNAYSLTERCRNGAVVAANPLTNAVVITTEGRYAAIQEPWSSGVHQRCGTWNGEPERRGPRRTNIIITRVPLRNWVFAVGVIRIWPSRVPPFLGTFSRMSTA